MTTTMRLIKPCPPPRMSADQARSSAQKPHRIKVGKEVQPLDGFALIRGVLRRQAEHVSDAERSQLRIMVAKATGLRCASACAGDGVPSTGKRLPGAACAGIGIVDRASAQLREVDPRAIRR